MPLRMFESTVRSRSPPPAATIMSIRERMSVLPFDARRIERKPRRIGTDPLPILHLALIAFLRDLRVEIDRRERMHHERCKSCCVGGWMRLHEPLPMGVAAFTETRHNSDAR